MKLLLAIAVARAAATTDVFLASDRLAASAAVLRCVTTATPPSYASICWRRRKRRRKRWRARRKRPATARRSSRTVSAEFDASPDARRGGADVDAYLAKVERSTSTYAVPVARWDRDKKHTSPCVVCVRNLSSLTP